MKRQKATISDVKRFPGFALLSEAALGSLAAGCSVLELPAKELLLTPGQPSEHFFVVLAGQILLYKLSPEGKRQIVHTVLPGSPFAEAVAFADKPYPVYAESSQAATLLSINSSRFREFLQGQPDVALSLLAGIYQKVRHLTELVEGLALKSVQARLAKLLLNQMKASGVREGESFALKQSKVAMAETLGTTPESISRALRQFKNQGLLKEPAKGKVILLNPNALADLAEE